MGTLSIACASMIEVPLLSGGLLVESSGVDPSNICFSANKIPPGMLLKPSLRLVVPGASLTFKFSPLIVETDKFPSRMVSVF